MTELAEERSDDKYGLDRIVFFSDAVIAIAITLLVITITAPEIPAGQVDAELASAVLEMWPQYLGFAVSFWVIAGYWIAHHKVFRHIVDYDAALLRINIVFLMFVAFMPYATELLFKYPAQLITVLLYAGVIAATGLTLFWMWAYATHNRRLVASSLTRATAQKLSRKLLAAPAAFLTSMLIALLSPEIAMYSWIVLLPVYTAIAKRQQAADG